MRAACIASSVTIGLFVSRLAFAQAQPPARPPVPVASPVTPPAAQPKPGVAPPVQNNNANLPQNTATPGNAPPLDPNTLSGSQIDVNDPLLQPVPAAAKTLKSWQEALQYIEQRSTNVLIAQQEIARAEGLYTQALSTALPNINGQASITHNFITHGAGGTTPITVGTATVQVPNPVPLQTTWLAELNASMPILAPQAWYSLKTNKLAIKAAQLSSDDVKRQTLITVANAIVSVVTAERAAELNRLGLRSTLELLDLTTRRQKLGSGTMLDIVRANQNVNAAKQTLVTGDESLRQAREALGIAMGFGEAWSVTSSISLNDITKTVNQICKPASPEQRTDVLAAKQNFEVAERGVTNAKLAYAPTAVVSSTLAVNGPVDSGGNPLGSWSIQGVLTVPIWDGNFKWGTVKVQESLREEARARIDAAARESNIESVQSVRGVQVAEATRLLSEQARDLAEENARLAKIAYAAGTETSFDLVDSNTKARQAELNLAVAEFEVVKAKIAALLANANCAY